MRKKNFSKEGFLNKAQGFDAPTSLPRDDDQGKAWQAANKVWWESTPMRYDWRNPVPFEPGTRAYFEEIDRRFFRSAWQYLPWKERPFERLIPYRNLADKDVLEIGVGQGSHAQLISPYCQTFTGIDLTEAASAMTSRRFAEFQLPGCILKMDAERMEFADASFDFIWSWGVIHHSANTLQILREMRRVLRRGGSATVMVYHRSLWRYYILDGFLNGTLRGLLRKKGSLHAVTQAGTDGAIARFYRPAEWETLCEGLFDIISIEVRGQKSDLLPLPAGFLKQCLEDYLPNAITSFLAHRLRMGTFLIIRMRRI